MRVETGSDQSICGYLKHYYDKNRLDKVIEGIVLAIFAIIGSIFIVGHIIVECLLEKMKYKATKGDMEYGYATK